ncbi:STAS domain-containing protein [Streptomyces sp. NPDC048301]|uniref:STAS domain-containing protein n=1 Tax=unclassified Streptomyces TaxID=2593676 RepID=UPI00342CAFD0
MSSGRPAGLPGVDATVPDALVVTGRITRADVPALCAELEAILASGPEAPGPAASGPEAPGGAVVDCDLAGVVRPDLAVVEAVARLSLIARRAGGRTLRLRGTPPELAALLDLLGLAEVIAMAEEPPASE